MHRFQNKTGIIECASYGGCTRGRSVSVQSVGRFVCIFLQSISRVALDM